MRPDSEGLSWLPRRTPQAAWVARPDQWDGEGAAVLILEEADRAARHAALRALLARRPGFAGAEVSVLHRAGRAPIIARDGPLLRCPALSCTVRGPLAALAVAPGPVGIDVEAVEEGADLPWSVLHPGERTALGALRGERLACTFAEIWSAKEAYVKALRLGLSCDPTSFSVLADGAAGWRIADPARPDARVLLETRGLVVAGARHALTLCLIDP